MRMLLFVSSSFSQPLINEFPIGKWLRENLYRKCFEKCITLK